MPNIAAAFKAEITRLSRKEVRDGTESLKKTVASQRAEILALKKRLQAIEMALRKIANSNTTGARKSADDASLEASESEKGALRFRAQGLVSNRKRLGLSASDFGLLVGATGQSVYAWESGRSSPRGKSLVAIAALRSVGKREALARLASLRGES